MLNVSQKAVQLICGTVIFRRSKCAGRALPRLPAGPVLVRRRQLSGPGVRTGCYSNPIGNHELIDHS